MSISGGENRLSIGRMVQKIYTYDVAEKGDSQVSKVKGGATALPWRGMRTI